MGMTKSSVQNRLATLVKNHKAEVNKKKVKTGCDDEVVTERDELLDSLVESFDSLIYYEQQKQTSQKLGTDLTQARKTIRANAVFGFSNDPVRMLNKRMK
jgi:hypothetical protein